MTKNSLIDKVFGTIFNLGIIVFSLMILLPKKHSPGDFISNSILLSIYTFNYIILRRNIRRRKIREVENTLDGMLNSSLNTLLESATKAAKSK